MLFDIGCSMFVVRCMSLGVYCCLLFVVCCCSLFLVGRLLFDVCMSICRLLRSVACLGLLFVVCC